MQKHIFDTKAIFKEVCTIFANGIRSSQAIAPKEHLASLRISFEKTGALFSSGQIAHRKPDEFLEKLEQVGILAKSSHPSNLERKAYNNCMNYALVWPLRDKAGDVVNLFAYRFSIRNKTRMYLNGGGIYPCYPGENTKTVIVTGDIIDAATVIEAELLDNKEAVISLHNGEIKDQHIEALSGKQLREAVLIGCPPTVASFIRERFPNLTVCEIPLPDGASLNSLWITGGKDKLLSLLATRTQSDIPTQTEPETGGLVRINQSKLLYRGDAADWYVLGAIGTDPATLTATVKIHFVAGQISVHQVDLFSVKDRSAIVKEAQIYGIHVGDVETDLMMLLNFVEEERDRQMEATLSTKHRRIAPDIPHARHMELLEFLSAPDLIRRIGEKLGETGIVEEERCRLCAFVIAATYQYPNPLHGLVSASSGTGKSFLLNSVASCIPEEAVISLTKTSAMSFFYLNGNDIDGKLVLIQDMDGLGDDAMFSFRELQSARSITNMRPYRDRKTGIIQSENREVRASFSSLSATTRSDILYDNISRSILLKIDEDDTQTRAIVEYLNRKRAGLVDTDAEENAKAFLRDMNRVLKPYATVNPYAHRISLPLEGHALRRLNLQFWDFTEALTIINQYRREKDTDGRLITTLEDIRDAAELFFEPIYLKSDHLDSGLREFFEQLKRYVRKRCPSNKFRMRDVMQTLRYSKSHVHRFFKDLRACEFIQVVGGSAARGFVYEISHFDDAGKTKEHIRKTLIDQIEAL